METPKLEFDFNEAFTEYELSQITAAMKQEAIAFMNWTLLAECEYSCTDEDQWTHQDILENGIAQNITTEQLYNLYLESKKQKV